MSTQQIRSLSHKRRILGSDYIDKVLALNPLVYFPLYEGSGTAAANLGSLGSAANGTYSGVTLSHTTGPDGLNGAPFFDGANDYVNIYSAALAAAFDGDEGTAIIWKKVYDAGVWTDDTYHFGLTLGADGNNRLQLLKGDAANSNQLMGSRRAASTNRVSGTAVTPNTWFHHAMTWSDSADEQRTFYTGSQYDTTKTGLASWVGPLVDTWCYIGAYNTGTMNWYGWLAHAAVFDYVVTPAQIAGLAII